jgi:hypothetical protein
MKNSETAEAPPMGDISEEPVLSGNGEVITEFAYISDDLVRLPESAFSEVWADVVAGRESSLKPSFPITDVVYFGAAVDRYGTIVDIPARRKLPAFDGKVHVSIICESAGLTHFLLEPESRARAKFFSELLELAHGYDGLNIDLESVPVQDAGNFLSLLRELKAALGSKVFSVCVPGRTSENQTYNYKQIASIVDKVFVMAYDEHWATSKPGPVASMNWCKSVASYALKTIGEDKLVMGIPFYGRSWADKSTARALVASTTAQLLEENEIMAIERENGIPKFSYDVNVTVTVYFEDAYSISTRMEMYREMQIDKVGFWRIGQEDPRVWDFIKLTPEH